MDLNETYPKKQLRLLKKMVKLLMLKSNKISKQTGQDKLNNITWRKADWWYHLNHVEMLQHENKQHQSIDDKEIMQTTVSAKVTKK